MPVIEARNLHKRYGTTVAVDDVSLAVEEGQILAVLGPNGAGKTTTVEMIAGLRQADSGTVGVLGHDPQRDPQAVRELLGMQLQAARLPPRITTREAVELYASFYARPAPPAELLERLGLAEKAGTAFKDLSGGQQQRLSIALALVGRPKVAVLDELTTGLDPHARREVWGLIEAVRDSGVSVLLVTHFMDEAEHLADDVVIIDDGRVVASGSPGQLMRSMSVGYQFRMEFGSGLNAGLIRELRALPEVAELTAVAELAVPGSRYQVSGTPEALPAVVGALSRSGVVPQQLHTVTHSLEDFFIDMTTRHEEIRS